MRLLLVDPNHPFDVYGPTIFSGPVHPSLTMATLGGAATDGGHEARVLDLRWEKDPPRRLAEEVGAFGPDLIGFTAFTLTIKTVKRLARLAREMAPGALLAVGGVHPSVEPEDALSASVFDAVAIGEGERTLADLLAGKPFESIPGLHFQGADGKAATPPRPLVTNLDELNFPDYRIFPLKKYFVRQPLWKSRRIAPAETSRGCPYHCSYCTSRSVFGSHWRPKSVPRVIEEIERLLSIGFEEIHFQDDGFTTDIGRAKEICRSILRLPKKVHWELTNGIRLDRVDEEFLELAARAGCYRIYFGVESGDRDVLQDVGKKIDPERARQVFRMTKKHGIEALAFFILGLPEDTKETLDETIRFAPSIKPNYTRASILVPFPGSPIFKKWKEEGRIVSEDWDRYHFHPSDTLVFRHPNLSDKEIISAYRRFYRRFYFSPSYLLDRTLWGLRRGTFLRDLKYFLSKFVAPMFLRKTARTT